MRSLFMLGDIDYRVNNLSFLLPVGISFYTFQTLSYTIDIYYNRMKPEKHFGRFALYVSFFPQLVAGPIERAKRLLPQFKIDHSFDYERVRNGIVLIMWGLFKKAVIADRVSEYINIVFASPEDHFGLQIWISMMLFYIQLYCDFSGYTDIAIGTAGIMGYKLMLNFKQPMIAQNFREFWSRWHISLTTWFRDYLYLELRTKDQKAFRNYISILIVFLATGFWHGANWTFLLFGLYHACALIGNEIMKPTIRNVKEAIGLLKYPKLNKGLNISYTFILLCLSVSLFRSNSIHDSIVLFGNLFDFSKGLDNINLFRHPIDFGLSIGFLILIFVIDFVTDKVNIGEYLSKQSYFVKWSLLIIILLSIFTLGKFGEEDFIYFQF